MKLAIVLALIVSLVPAAAAESSGARRFEGEYHWSDGGDDALRATFSPAGDGAWKVEFEFEFSGQRHTWKGTATGSLDDGGELSGTVEGSGGRTWEFEAKVASDGLAGTHTETTGGRRHATGTFVLKS